MNSSSNSKAATLAALGALALTGFLVVFTNIAWDWSMFMDDTLYNTWMPGVTNLREAFRSEIHSYLTLGRFYPVKYLANLLKWRFLPNDPFAFRCFNFSVFLLTAALAAAAALRACAEGLRQQSRGEKSALFVFLVGSSFLHKPLLEVISLNPLGETWVCFFLAAGALALFQEKPWIRFGLSRVFFLLVALSKEPAALVFFAAGSYHLAQAWLEPKTRRSSLLQAILDYALFAFFLGMALWVMAHGTFTKGAYFSTTPYLSYARDFAYKLARYALWTSPFLVFFSLCRKSLWEQLRSLDPKLIGAAIFFSAFGFSYDVFMASQGIVAYQQTPAAIGYFGFFSLLAASLYASDSARTILSRHGALLLALFCLSYFISVGRWARFVRGMVEPRRAVVNLIRSGEQLSIFVPRGEVYGHVELLLKQFNPKSHVFDANDDLSRIASQVHGRVIAFEFPVYMGNLPAESLERLERFVGGWAGVTDSGTYRVYIGQKIQGEPSR